MYHLVTSLVEDDEAQSERQTLQTLGYHWEDSSQKYIHIFKKNSYLRILLLRFRHLFPLTFDPSLSIILKMMSAFIGTSQTPSL